MAEAWREVGLHCRRFGVEVEVVIQGSASEVGLSRFSRWSDCRPNWGFQAPAECARFGAEPRQGRLDSGSTPPSGDGEGAGCLVQTIVWLPEGQRQGYSLCLSTNQDSASATDRPRRMVGAGRDTPRLPLGDGKRICQIFSAHTSRLLYEQPKRLPWVEVSLLTESYKDGQIGNK